MKQPLVSIIIPSYNVEKYLADACNSVLAQTYVNWEGIIIDDGSIDNTKSIAEDFCKRDKRFVYIYQENKGLSGARKTGIDKAKGEFVQFLDADDALMPERLEQMVEASSKVEENVILYSDFWIGLNNSVKDKVVASSRNTNIGRDLQFDDMYYGWRENFLFVPACPFFKKECFKIAAYDASLRSVEDWDIYLSILSKGFCFRFILERSVIYRDNPFGLSKDKTFIYKSLFFVLYKWRQTTPFSEKNYIKKCAILFSEVLFNHFFIKNTRIICPLPNKSNNIGIILFNMKINIFTLSFFLKRFIKAALKSLKKRLF